MKYAWTVVLTLVGVVVVSIALPMKSEMTVATYDVTIDRVYMVDVQHDSIVNGYVEHVAFSFKRNDTTFTQDDIVNIEYYPVTVARARIDEVVRVKFSLFERKLERVYVLRIPFDAIQYQSESRQG
ncbi:MAG: hypothetical protein PHY34_01210 [Patescibacteria group bacterium]|nr:hypothetical protein [Patescibacteria group bacterium]MDD5715163.1 hypothetical protein [Patescibacteria group bacterium]